MSLLPWTAEEERSFNGVLRRSAFLAAKLSGPGLTALADSLVDLAQERARRKAVTDTKDIT
jgi:hypothetical protein